MPSRRQILTSGIAALTGSLAAGCRRNRKDGPTLRAFAFVANYDGKAIAVADLSAFAVARHVALDDHPTELVAPRRFPGVIALTPASGVLHEVDLEGFKLKRRLSLGNPATTMRVHPDGKRLFVLSPKRIQIVDLAAFSVANQISLPEPCVSLDIAPYLDAVALPSASGGRIHMLNASESRISGAIQVPSDGDPGTPGTAVLGPVRFLSNGKSLIAADLSNRTISVFDTASRQRIVDLPVSMRPDRFCFSADGGQLFVTGDGSNALAIVFPYYTPQVAETVLAGRNPGAMAASEDPAYLFVANRASGDVTILNVRTRKLVATVGVGEEPDFVTVTPDGLHTLVLNRKSGDMAVLRVGGITRNRQRMASLFTMIPVGSTPVSAVVRSI